MEFASPPRPADHAPPRRTSLESGSAGLSRLVASTISREPRRASSQYSARGWKARAQSKPAKDPSDRPMVSSLIDVAAPEAGAGSTAPFDEPRVDHGRDGRRPAPPIVSRSPAPPSSPSTRADVPARRTGARAARPALQRRSFKASLVRASRRRPREADRLRRSQLALRIIGTRDPRARPARGGGILPFVSSTASILNAPMRRTSSSPSRARLLVADLA